MNIICFVIPKKMFDKMNGCNKYKLIFDLSIKFYLICKKMYMIYIF